MAKGQLTKPLVDWHMLILLVVRQGGVDLNVTKMSDQYLLLHKRVAFRGEGKLFLVSKVNCLDWPRLGSSQRRSLI